MLTWVFLLIAGIVLVILARYAFPSPPVDRILYALGVICLVVAAVFFIFWLVALGSTADVDTLDSMGRLLLA